MVLALPGVTGNSSDRYLLDLRGESNLRVYEFVVFTHFATPGETDLRIMDMSNTKYLDEVLEFTKNRFDNKETGEECEIFLVGYSLGGNHSLRYMGGACKQKHLHGPHFPKDTRAGD